jgi:hypothetical protein
MLLAPLVDDRIVVTPAADEPPQSLLDLAEAVRERLGKSGLSFSIGFLAPTSVTWWRMAVDLDHETVDDLFAAPGPIASPSFLMIRRRCRTRWPPTMSPCARG